MRVSDKAGAEEVSSVHGVRVWGFPDRPGDSLRVSDEAGADKGSSLHGVRVYTGTGGVTLLEITKNWDHVISYVHMYIQDLKPHVNSYVHM